MQVFKAYFKIIKSHLLSISIYFFIFALLAVFITRTLHNTPETTFLETRSKVAVFNHDNTPLSEGLKNHLLENASVVDLKDDEQSIQDALFFGQIDYAIWIPEGFASSIMQESHDILLKRTASPSSTSSVYMDFLVNKYLNAANLYVKNLKNISQAQIAENVSRDLSQKADVKLNTYDKPKEMDSLSYYFQYMAYSLLAVLIMGVTSFMMSFNHKDLSDRNLCSPMSPFKMNLQIVLSNTTFGLVICTLLCAMVFVLNGNVPRNIGTLLYCLNALAFTFVSLSIGFLAGKFVKSHGAQGAITNVVSLGVSFLSGIFVEQALLGKTVLAVASFTPGYWYVRAVETLRGTVSFSFDSILPVLYDILIQLGFAAALIIIALVITKQKKTSRV